MTKGKLSKDTSIRPDQIRPGDYYRRVTKGSAKDGDREVPQGELMVITDFKQGSSLPVHYACGQNEFQCNEEALWIHFEYEPNGADLRDQEIKELLTEARKFVEVSNELSKNEDPLGLANKLPEISKVKFLSSADDNDDESDENDENTSTALIYQPSEPMGVRAAKLRSDITKRKNSIAKFAKAVKLRHQRIEALRKEQKNALEAALRIQSLMAIAEEVILTINVYLGNGEEVVIIKEGDPAPPQQKISVRQRTLYADEETALDPKDGGLDFQQLDKFDNWIKQPKNLQQVLPETKGIVAIKPRRSDKDYGGDPWSNSERNRENKRTYFLIRNGDNLYRVTTSVGVGKTIFPTRNEFDEIFFRNDRDWKTNVTTKIKMRPGTSEFAQALETANSEQRRYGRILLFMQGLLDRSKIFHPLVDEDINLMSQKESGNYIHYVYDAEMLLPTGRLGFDKWLQSINNLLEVGHRIVGTFSGYGQRGLYSSQGDCKRVSPRGAGYPDSMVLHTIENRNDDQFIIRYAREGERVWTRYGSHDPKRRASCYVTKSDNFIINFDAAQQEDMEFYLQSRVDRHHYIDMFPLIEACVAMKKKEAKDEKPFRQLLISQISKESGDDIPTVEQSIDTIVHWWKFKNKTHRALSKDDSKAIRMIVQEYCLRDKKNTRYSENEYKISSAAFNVLNELTQEGKEVVFIGYKNWNYITVIVAENKSNVYVNEQVWKITKEGDAELESEKPWSIVDNRRLRWQQIFKSPRWDKWAFNADKSKHLTDPEKEEALAKIPGLVKARFDQSKKNQNNGVKSGYALNAYLPLVLQESGENAFTLYICDSHPPLRIFNRTTNQRPYYLAPTVGGYTVYWTRDKTGTKFSTSHGGHYSDTHPWEDRWRKDSEIIWQDPEAIAKYDGWVKAYEEADDNLDKVLERSSKYNSHLHKRIKEQQKSDAFDAYMNERDGDVELWDDEWKSLKVKELHCNTYDTAVFTVMFAGVDIKGFTIGQIIDKAAELGYEMAKEDQAMIFLLLNEKALPNEETEDIECDEDDEDDEDDDE